MEDVARNPAIAEDFMLRAVELACSVQGKTSTNPPVGAILVKNGHIVGAGATQPPGAEHAEIVALRQAGNQSHGACLYVTLEPCSHFGRTPPCVDALIQAGIEGAHIATLDPNPRVDGTGARTLRTHGIRVTLGPCVERAQELIQPHAKFTRTGVPYLTLLLDLPVSVGREFDEQADFVLDWKMAGVDGQFIPELQKELASEGRIVWSLRATRDQAADWLRLGAVDRIISVPGLPMVPGFEYQRELSTHEQPVILYRRVASLQ